MAGLPLEGLRRALAGDLDGWRGLPPGLTAPALIDCFPRDSDWSGAAPLGESRREASYFWVDVPAPVAKLRAWTDGARVLLLDFDASGLPIKPGALARLLGEAAAALDTWWGLLPMPRSELVFPHCGAAAFVNRERRSVWHLALFQPTTMADYVEDLRLDMETRRHRPNAR